VSGFLKAFSKTASGSIISMFFGALLVKIIAVFAGPQGIGVFSLLKDLSKTLVLGLSLSGNVAIVQGLSNESIVDKDLYINNVLKIILYNCFGLTLIYLFLLNFIHAQYFSEFEEITLMTLVIVLISGIFGALNVVCNAILNANRKLGSMALSQVSAAVFGVIVTYPFLVFLDSIYSYALILVAINAFWLLINFYFIFKNNIKVSWRRSIATPVDNINLTRFRSLSIGTLITGIAGMFTILSVRFFVKDKLGIEELGFFDAAWTLGTIYIVFILSSFATYVLPTLASLTNDNEINRFMEQTLIMVVAIFLPIILTMLTFKSYFIWGFYSSEFTSSIEVLHILLIGDVFKVFAWSYGILFLSFNKPWPFVAVSLLWDVIFVITAYFAIEQFGMVGTAYAYVITQIIYLLVLMRTVKHYFSIKFGFKVVTLFFTTLIFVIIAAWLNSNSINIGFYFSCALAYIVLIKYLYKNKMIVGI